MKKFALKMFMSLSVIAFSLATISCSNESIDNSKTNAANSAPLTLEEAVKQQEIVKAKLDTIRQETLRDHKGLDQWKTETRKEIRGLMKEVEKCIPQVETMVEKK